MSNHRNPRPSLSRPFPDKFAPTTSHDDVLANGPLADHGDTIAHELGELLDNPHLIAAQVPSARSTFAPDVVALDGVPEFVALDAPTASRTLIADERMRHEPRRCT